MKGNDRTRILAPALVGLVVLAVAGLSGTALAFVPPPNTVQFELNGCRNGGTNPIGDQPNADGRFVCTDPAPLGGNDTAYVAGNLGKDWNELDLVPHRLITTNSGSSGSVTYNVIVAADSITAGRTGYDVLTEPEIIPSGDLNGFSDPSCALSYGPESSTGSVTGGADTVIYRELQITQDPDTTCVIDFTLRLAVGASEYPGSSLQSYMFESDDFSTGKRTVSIPTNEIVAQKLSKEMDASQDSEHIWTIAKEISPGSVDFGDTCKTDPAEGAPVTVTISWTKFDASPSGDVMVATTISAYNPASRAIDVIVTDQIFSGTTLLGELACEQTTVGPDISTTVCTHVIVIPEADAVDLNDIAVATYIDTATGVPVELTTEAVASADVQSSGIVRNEGAYISDTESISSDNGKLSYSVDGFTGAVGFFDGAYVAGTVTKDDVVWDSELQSDSGSVAFDKTIYFDEPTITEGQLSDLAELEGTDRFSTSTTGSISIEADAFVELTIDKIIPNILQVGQTLETQFRVTYPDGSVQNVTIAFAAGETEKSVTLEGLEPGLYSVAEVSAGGLTPLRPLPVDVDLNLPNCSATEVFENVVGQEQFSRAQVQKITDPVLPETDPDYDWQMTLSGTTLGGVPVGPELLLAQAGQGYVLFGQLLEEGTYTITELEKDGWDSDGGSLECSFTVDYPADFGRTFSCTYTNTERAMVEVLKTNTDQAGNVLDPSGFAFQIRKDASTSDEGTVLATGTSDAGGNVVFVCEAGVEADCENVGGVAKLVPGGNYQLCETGLMPGWATSLVGFVPGSGGGSTVDNSTICQQIDPALEAGETRKFDVDNTPPPGGDARTPGFWKNWSSCSGGNQNDVLDDTLEYSPFMMDGQHGFWIGDLFIYECETAVSILATEDVNTGDKHANDAAYGLARNLFAAILNNNATVDGEPGLPPDNSMARTCVELTDAMQMANDFLAGNGSDFDPNDCIQFDGTGTYLSPQAIRAAKGNSCGKRELRELRSLALEWAGNFDLYNNNEPGPWSCLD